ncbi:MAG: response regulator [Candidatus Pacebacteria bacterium]|nr:response regulator [Candidatus Paceibacterota bacterium]
MRNPPLILLVDDEPNFRDVLEIKLKNAGYQTTTAQNGEEGIAKAKELIPDLILMDIKMPKMDGLQALDNLQNDVATKNIKIVMLTAFGDPQSEIYENHKRFAKEIGATSYLLKSQDIDYIVNKVKDIISKTS